MRNCLKTYAQECTDGRMQPFSVREIVSGKRVACFMLVRAFLCMPWTVMEVAGPMNVPASEKMKTIATLTCEWCNDQDTATRASDD